MNGGFLLEKGLLYGAKSSSSDSWSDSSKEVLNGDVSWRRLR